MVNKENIENPESYPFNLPLIKYIEDITFSKRITFLVGENGTGKSTFIEALATSYGFNPEGGNKNIFFKTQDTHSSLHEHITLQKGVLHAKRGLFIRGESMYNMVSRMSEDYGDITQHSHGESFFTILNQYFYEKGLYILDEPEAGLSPTAQFAFLNYIDELAKNHSAQFIIATHSPLLIAHPDAMVYEFSEDAVEEKHFSNTQLYGLYERFFLDEKYVERILKGDDSLGKR